MQELETHRIILTRFIIFTKLTDIYYNLIIFKLPLKESLICKIIHNGTWIGPTFDNP